MGSAIGAEKVAANRIGISLEAYRDKLFAGLKWCHACKEWHTRDCFGRDAARGDGLAAKCLASKRTGRPIGWHGKKPINPLTGRPGPVPCSARDGDKIQARYRVNLEVRNGGLPHPNTLACVDCGHMNTSADDTRHEYDHHHGYGAENHLDVQCVCKLCHGRRTYARGEISNEKLKRAASVRSAKRKTHCQKGHPMSRQKDGGWRCGECRLKYWRERHKLERANG